MELPQPRPFGTESRKPTHDFLSLYSPVQQDPKPPAQGGYLKTHDFLQPLEHVKEKNKVVVNDVGKAVSGVEHIVLPGGIGTYSISHIPNYINHQRVPKPEGVMFTTVAAVPQASSSERNDENNSNCSSYTAGSGFTLWEESAAKKGKTGKENISEDNFNVIKDAEGVTIGGGGQWPPPLSSSNHNHNPILGRPVTAAQKNQSFIDMIKSAAKTAHQDGDDYDDDDEDFVVKKEPSSSSHSHPHLNGNLSVKVDEKRSDQKPNTPRSKHSATEQRRRSKINDRFHMLRGLIPHGDQKRDKASFLLEVIEYIQFLQEKVHKYEDSYPGWNHEPPKLMSWGKNHGMLEEFVDLSRITNCVPGPAVMFAAKFDENKINVSPTMPINGHNLVESGSNGPDSFKETDKAASSIPVLLHPNIFSSGGGSSSAATPLPARLASHTEHRPCQQPQSQPWQSSRSGTTECTAAVDQQKDEEALTIESGTISISTVYSQGLLNTLTQALQSSGVDLSQATISVQIDLGKRANSTLNSSTSVLKDDHAPSSNQTMARSRLASTGGNDESDQSLKRQKTGRT